MNMKTSHLLTIFGLVDLQDPASNWARNQGCHLLLTQAVKVGTQQLEGGGSCETPQVPYRVSIPATSCCNLLVDELVLWLARTARCKLMLRTLKRILVYFDPLLVFLPFLTHPGSPEGVGLLARTELGPWTSVPRELPGGWWSKVWKTGPGLGDRGGEGQISPFSHVSTILFVFMHPNLDCFAAFKSHSFAGFGGDIRSFLICSDPRS